MKKKQVFGMLLLAVLPVVNGLAQCAMCRTTVESTISDGRNDVGNGLNFGIVYMLVFPYILVSLGVFLWFRKAKENQLKKCNWKNN
jgi:hypothetical protein